jgi:hypothetical protein
LLEKAKEFFIARNDASKRLSQLFLIRLLQPVGPGFRIKGKVILLMLSSVAAKSPGPNQGRNPNYRKIKEEQLPGLDPVTVLVADQRGRIVSIVSKDISAQGDGSPSSGHMNHQSVPIGFIRALFPFVPIDKCQKAN